jgi:hypothetical protein
VVYLPQPLGVGAAPGPTLELEIEVLKGGLRALSKVAVS